MPELLYNLELDALELYTLLQVFRSLAADDVLSPTEETIREKVQRLMEGR
jgi:hypothetical protein